MMNKDKSDSYYASIKQMGDDKPTEVSLYDHGDCAILFVVDAPGGATTHYFTYEVFNTMMALLNGREMEVKK